MQGDSYKAVTLTAFVLHHPMSHRSTQQGAQQSLDTLQKMLDQALFLQAVEEGCAYELGGLTQELLSNPFISGNAQ
jgi:glycine cleavage system protein P-like pyridoxal-binding family